MSELRALQGSERLMKGAVRNLNWTLHPFPGPAHTVVFSVSAQGVLNDGNDTPFSLHASHVITDPPSPPTVVRSVVFNLQVRN